MSIDAKGRKFEIHKIHQPAPMYYTQEELQDLHFDFQEKFERHIENRMPASYVRTIEDLAQAAG
jgi:agmatine/peptidylarginine deiminase